MYPKEVDERFVLTPTTAQVYASDPESYNDLLSDDKKAAVKKEKETKDEEDKAVDGTESLYNALYRLTAGDVPLSSVEGSEGVLANIKSGFTKVLKWLKEFLIWLKQVIFGRKARVHRQSDDLAQLIKSGTVKPSAVYPRSAYALFPITKSRKLGDIPNNLEWLKEEQKRIKAFVVNAKKVIDTAERTLTLWSSRYSDVVDGKITKVSDFDNLVNVYEELWKPLGLTVTNRQEQNNVLGLQGYIFGSYNVNVQVSSNSTRFDTTKENRATSEVRFSTSHSTVKAIFEENERLTTELNSLTNGSEKALRMMIKVMERAINRVMLSDRTEPMKEIARFINSYIAVVGRFTTFSTVDILKVQENINRLLLASFK